MSDKIRIDVLLVRKGFVESRSLAQRRIMAGEIRVDGQVVFKPAQLVDQHAILTLDAGPKYVSRGGQKLAHGLRSFHIEVDHRICADVGASTGGFTDCFLQFGATRVYAIDVGSGQLIWKLRQDPRVVVMEKTNARYLKSLPEAMDIVAIDVSFISLDKILPAVIGWLKQDSWIVALVKPQFEAGRESVGRGGIVKDREVHRAVLLDTMAAAHELGLHAEGLIRSPIRGAKGNVEFLLALSYGSETAIVDPQSMVDAVLEAKKE